jgi:ribosomal-protein-alanine N-acetyltransferase
LRSYLKINGIWQDHLLYSLIEGEEQQRAQPVTMENSFHKPVAR